MEFFDRAKSMLAVDEGDIPHLYDDAEPGAPRFVNSVGDLTGGIGHNFSQKPLTPAVRALLFLEDYTDALEDCRALMPRFDTYSDPRRLALLNMAFALGRSRLSGFRRMLEAVNADPPDWRAAAHEAKNSLFYLQVKARAERIRHMLETDEVPNEYRE